MKKLAPGAVFYDIYKKFHIAFVNIFPVILYLLPYSASLREGNLIQLTIVYHPLPPPTI